MYARGLSTRDIEDAFLGPDGELLLSRTAVSEITDRLWEDYQAFCAATCRRSPWSTCSSTLSCAMRRHLNRAVMKGHRHRAVAAAR
jgi:hypothetical protein